jgi:phosphomannomutase
VPKPEAAGAGRQIVFGTDGWRARIADEYTFDAVRACAAGVAEWVANAGGADRGVVVGYDRRFASEHFAAAAAEVVAARGVRVHLASTDAPTPALSWATLRWKAKAGIVITASHNPWIYNGFKVKSEIGTSAGPEMLAAIQPLIQKVEDRPDRIPRLPLAEARATGLVEDFDPAVDYLAHIGEIFDLDAFRGAGKTLVCDPLYGSGGGYFPRLLGGGRTKVIELHGERNPFFGGVNPEPIQPNLNEFLARIVKEHADIGLAVDGDADRAGLGDEQGTFASTLTVYALLMWYLIEVRGLRKPVVKTVSMSSMVDRLGKRFGVEVHEVPVGFKYVGPKMVETGAMMGGEESGGFSFAMNMPERDGIVADLFLLDFMLKTKKTPSALIAELMALAGPSFYNRRDIHIDQAAYEAAKTTLAHTLADLVPGRLADAPVAHTVHLPTGDGAKYFLDDGSWLLIRFSGTEPLVRVYAETLTRAALEPLLDAGQAIVKGAL